MELVQQAHPKLHIEAVVGKVVRWLFVIVGALLGVVIVVSLIRGAPWVPKTHILAVWRFGSAPRLCCHPLVNGDAIHRPPES